MKTVLNFASHWEVSAATPTQLHESIIHWCAACWLRISELLRVGLERNVGRFKPTCVRPEDLSSGEPLLADFFLWKKKKQVKTLGAKKKSSEVLSFRASRIHKPPGGRRKVAPCLQRRAAKLPGSVITGRLSLRRVSKKVFRTSVFVLVNFSLYCKL